jgi:hypothetical protein
MNPFQLPDLTDKKIVFPDWLFIQAGYGYRTSNTPQTIDPSKYSHMVPRGIELRIFPPKIDPEPLIRAELPWEKFYIGAYSTVVFDPLACLISDKNNSQPGIHRLYYECFRPMGPRWTDLNSLLCYAESRDLQHWFKPNLGIAEYQGSKENNILFTPEMNQFGGGLHGTHVFIDPNGSPEERYKLTYCGPKSQTFVCTSADGLHWKTQPNRILESEADSENVLEWDPIKKKYIAYSRRWQYDRRGINYAETEDFWYWPIPIPLLLSDPTLPPDADYYTNSYHRWPGTEALVQQGLGAAIMFPAMYYRTSDKVKPEILFSRNNLQWFRPSANPLWDPQGTVYFGRGIWSPKPGEWCIFMANYEHTHNVKPDTSKPIGGLYAARFREDGFCGVNAEGIGEFWSIPFRCQRGVIRVNATGPAHSWLRAELVDELTGEAIEERNFEHCTSLFGDILWDPIQWDDGGTLEEYNDVHLILHIQMYQKTLFGLKFG